MLPQKKKEKVGGQHGQLVADLSNFLSCQFIMVRQVVRGLLRLYNWQINSAGMATEVIAPDDDQHQLCCAGTQQQEHQVYHPGLRRKPKPGQMKHTNFVFFSSTFPL